MAMGTPADLPLPVIAGRSFRTEFATELTAADAITTLQVNIGYVCNLACRHCHVESSPARTAPEDNMDGATVDRVSIGRRAPSRRTRASGPTRRTFQKPHIRPQPQTNRSPS